MTLLPHQACVAFKRKSAAMGERARPWLSIVGWFFPLPWLGTLPVALRDQLATSHLGVHERYSEGFVWTDKMIVRSPPFQVDGEVRSLLDCGPGSASQRCHAMTHGQIHPFDTCSIQSSREAQFLQGSLESCACSKAHDMRDLHQLAPPVAFFHLPIDLSCCHLPCRTLRPRRTIWSHWPKWAV